MFHSWQWQRFIPYPPFPEGLWCLDGLLFGTVYPRIERLGVRLNIYSHLAPTLRPRAATCNVFRALCLTEHRQFYLAFRLLSHGRLATQRDTGLASRSRKTMRNLSPWRQTYRRLSTSFTMNALYDARTGIHNCCVGPKTTEKEKRKEEKCECIP